MNGEVNKPDDHLSVAASNVDQNYRRATIQLLEAALQNARRDKAELLTYLILLARDEAAEIYNQRPILDGRAC